MKKLIWSISVFAGLFLLSNCADKDGKVYVEIPDANFRTYLLEKFDINRDGMISLAEAKRVKEIDCSGRNIKVLDGIEKFANLERLICKDNELSELELRYNRKLNWLVCTNNADKLTVYFGASSPLRNKNFTQPNDNATPDVSKFAHPFDVSKGIFDEDKTIFYISFKD